MKFLILILFTVSLNAHAESISIRNKDYKSAKTNPQYLSFTMASWKIGLFKSTFVSYVKNFDLTYKRDKNIIKEANLFFDVESMDTDINARNEKMWDFCLDYKSNPQIKILLLDKIDLSKADSQNVEAKLKIRGVDHTIRFNTTVKKLGDTYEAIGEADLRLSELKIPDPSIAVGSVEDAFKIKFKINEALK